MLHFKGGERSDWINFVLKDGDSWYDNKGTNYHVPLQSGGGAAAVTPLVQEPPTELCGVWAYIKWENDGCPNRPGHEADAEYQLAIQARLPSPHARGPRHLLPGPSTGSGRGGPASAAVLDRGGRTGRAMDAAALVAGCRSED